jgi:hypothetical protein
MRKITIAAAVAVLAASLASFIMPHPLPAGSAASPAPISPYELTLAAPSMSTPSAPDAF